MHPYLQAFALHQQHATQGQMPPWPVILDFHLQHGHLIATPQIFILARPVSLARLDIHPELIIDPDPDPGTFHIMAAAGTIRHLFAYARAHNVRHITYQRRTQTKLHHLTLNHSPHLSPVQ
jgi:hypothetical protein